MSEAGTQTQMEHAPGSFCWIELATTDGPGAKKFYSELFGWTTHDSTIGPDMVYTIIRLDGKDVGALYQKGETMKDVPTHWASYISVVSADEVAAKAKSLGGTVLKEPFDVFDAGRMAVITDPTGATFCIWQAIKHSGVGVKGQPNSLSWNELLTNDTARAIDFYTKLFGWKIDANNPMGYRQINTGSSEGIQGGIWPAPPQAPTFVQLFVTVDNVQAAAKNAEALGAKLLIPPTMLPEGNEMAVMLDPQGMSFGIWRQRKS